MFNDKFEVEESFTIDSVHNSFQCHKIIQPVFLIQSSELAFFDPILNTLSTFHKQQFNYRAGVSAVATVAWQL